jgi:hypothetical protein
LRCRGPRVRKDHHHPKTKDDGPVHGSLQPNAAGAPGRAHMQDGYILRR